MAGTVIALPNDFASIPDAFSGVAGKVAGEVQDKKSVEDIRRPLMGTQRKVDTYASIRIIQSNGGYKEIPNSSDRGSKGAYFNFMLQSFDEQRMEKSQVIETFGESYVYFFGERTPTVRFSGLLMNTEDFNWKSEFLYNYEKHFRGTQLIKNNTRAFVRVGDSIFGGYLVDVQVSESAENPEQCPFAFSLIVTDRVLLNHTSKNRVKDNFFGAPISIPYAPRYDEPQEAKISKSGFENYLNQLQTEVAGFTDFLRKGTDSVVGLLRALSSGRVVSVPDIILPTSYLQVRTTGASLADGTVVTENVLSGEPLKISPIAPYTAPEIKYTGEVTDNKDEYITGLNTTVDQGIFKELAAVDKKAATGRKLRKFLKEVGMDEYRVDGLSTTARLLGRVGFGLVGSFSASPANYLRRKDII